MAKVKGPFAEMERLSAPLFRSTRPEAARPLTVPPTVYRGGGLVEQETVTLVTFAFPMVPEPPETLQVCPDGWEKTVTE